MKKGVIFSVKRCYRAICNHLVLVCFMFFLVFLYGSFPLIFFMLVSASPVLVCTLVLLGALLSFGKSDLPKIELDKCETHEVVILKNAFADDNHVERNESEPMEKNNYKGTDIEELTNLASEIVNDLSNVGLDGSSGKKVENIFREEEFNDRVKEKGKKRFKGFYLKHKRKMLEERIVDKRIADNQYSLINADDTDDEGDLGHGNKELLVGSVDSIEANVDDLDSLPGSPWKHVDKAKGYEDDDEAQDSGSSGAKSSSPDASMAEISPVLDELHPLLEEDNLQPVNLSCDNSNASSELTILSSGSSNEQDDDIDDPEELMVGVDDEEDDEEEINEQNAYRTKSAITWTEEDQKNLMDLGTSELERNKRLENLIAKRRARRCMTTVTERNLIDLDISDPPMNVSPIMTQRSNPFDPPLESYQITSLPQIPGSAPTTRLPWKNPFDIPFDLSDEKPDLMDNHFQQEFMPQQSKDPTFRRHESFNVHPSSFGMNRTEKQDMEFMPQQSKDLTFRRHESFNVSFGTNLKEKHVMNKFRPYFVSEQLGSEGTSYSPINRQPSEASGSKESSVPDTESFSSTEEEILIIDDEDGNAQEPEMISRMDDASELVGHGSESSSSSDEESLELGQVEERHIKVDELDMKLEDVDNHQRTESSIKTQRSIENQMEIGSTKIHQNTEALDTTPKEPVYDSSPSEAFDPQVDSKVDLSSIVVKKSVSFSNRVTQIGSSGVDIDSIVDKVMLANNSEKTLVDEREMTSSRVDYITKHEIVDDKGESESMVWRGLNMIKERVSPCSVKENLTNGHGDFHKGHEGEFEPPVSTEEVDTFKDVGSDSDESDMKKTMQNTPEDTFRDVGSDSDEYDVTETMQNTLEDTFRDVGSNSDESDMKETIQNAPDDSFMDVSSNSDGPDMKESMQNTPEDTFRDVDSDSDESDIKKTVQNPSDVTLRDVDSDSDETDMKETMQNTPEDTTSEVTTTNSSDFGSPNTNNMKEKSSIKSSSSTSSSSSSSRSRAGPRSGSYASLSE